MVAENLPLRCLLLLLICATCYCQMACLDDPCRCNGGAINCTCTKSRQNITIDKLTDKEIFSLEIHGCGTVKIGIRAFEDTSLNALVLHDLVVLIVMPLAFAGAHRLQHIDVSDVLSFRPMSHGFHGLGSITQIMLNNLTSETLPKDFLYVKDITYLIMSNLNIGTLGEKAIRVDVGFYISLVNSTVRRMEEAAIFSPEGFEQVFLLKNQLGTVGYHAFTMNAINNFIIKSCKIEYLEFEFFKAEEVDEFLFDNNTVDLCGSGAFSMVNPIHNFWFKLNVFRIVRNGSLPSNSQLVSNSTSLQIENNLFQCNCELEWLWHQEYDIYRNTSFCSNKKSVNTAISFYIVVMDSRTCTDITIRPN